MATLVPPAPKRQRLASSTAEGATASGPVPNLVAQFRDSSSGELLGPSISLPGDTDKHGLELLVNKLRGSDEDPLPFSFHVDLPEPAPVHGKAADSQGHASFPIHDSLFTDLLQKYPSRVSSEDILVINCQPEAVFRVREVRRCSSSISGVLYA